MKDSIVAVILISGLVVTLGCGGADDGYLEADASTNPTTGNEPADDGGPERGVGENRDLRGPQITLGILALESTEDALTPEQAIEIRDLWQAAQNAGRRPDRERILAALTEAQKQKIAADRA